MGIRIGETGLNPTIPLCPVCNKPKNEIALTGLAGEKWAKKNGRSDGQMPMYSHIYGDINPCDECKKQGITIVEATQLHGYTGRLFLVKEELIKKALKSQEMIQKILKERICYMEPELLERLGFPPFQPLEN